MTADQQRQVQVIVQRWLDTNEKIYPSYQALRELAVLLHLSRQTQAKKETVQP